MQDLKYVVRLFVFFIISINIKLVFSMEQELAKSYRNVYQFHWCAIEPLSPRPRFRIACQLCGEFIYLNNYSTKMYIRAIEADGGKKSPNFIKIDTLYRKMLASALQLHTETKHPKNPTVILSKNKKNSKNPGYNQRN